MSSIPLMIGQQTIQFPNSGSDPNWSPAVIDFAKAVTAQLASLGSPFDIAPKVQILTSDANTSLNIQDAIFPSGSVRSFTLYYVTYRQNGVIALVEQGEIKGVFNTLTTTWTLCDQYNGNRQSDGTPWHSFQMSGDQLQINLTAMGGSYNTTLSTLGYSAKTELVTD